MENESASRVPAEQVSLRTASLCLQQEVVLRRAVWTFMALLGIAGWSASRAPPVASAGQGDVKSDRKSVCHQPSKFSARYREIVSLGQVFWVRVPAVGDHLPAGGAAQRDPCGGAPVPVLDADHARRDRDHVPARAAPQHAEDPGPSILGADSSPQVNWFSDSPSHGITHRF